MHNQAKIGKGFAGAREEHCTTSLTVQAHQEARDHHQKILVPQTLQIVNKVSSSTGLEYAILQQMALKNTTLRTSVNISTMSISNHCLRQL